MTSCFDEPAPTIRVPLKQLLHGRGGSKSYVLSTGIRGRTLSRQPDGTDIAERVALGYRCDGIVNPETRRLFQRGCIPALKYGVLAARSPQTQSHNRLGGPVLPFAGPKVTNCLKALRKKIPRDVFEAASGSLPVYAIFSIRKTNLADDLRRNRTAGRAAAIRKPPRDLTARHFERSEAKTRNLSQTSRIARMEEILRLSGPQNDTALWNSRHLARWVGIRAGPRRPNADDFLRNAPMVRVAEFSDRHLRHTGLWHGTRQNANVSSCLRIPLFTPVIPSGSEESLW